jgi:hypothetical protein
MASFKTPVQESGAGRAATARRDSDLLAEVERACCSSALNARISASSGSGCPGPVDRIVVSAVAGFGTAVGSGYGDQRRDGLSGRRSQ